MDFKKVDIEADKINRVKAYDPYKKYASTEDISLDFIVEDWDCKIVEPKHPALHKKATINPFGGDINWAEREQEMFKLMHDKFGIGLACPQVGSSYNMFVMKHSILGDLGIYKPEILETAGDPECRFEEGCLTFPMLYLDVKRPEKVKVRYYKNDGVTQVETWMDGIDARCFQHEFEHLQGELFLDRVSDLKLQRAYKKREKFFKKLEKQMKNA
jgi:peptide deformylase